MASPGESLNLDVMSPVTVAFLLDAISDINKTADIGKVRRYSGSKPGGKALQGKSISSDGRSSSSEDEDDSSSASSGSTSNHGNGITLPPVSTVFSNDLLRLSCTTAQIMPPSPTLVDVTNGLQQHRQQLLQRQQLEHQQQHAVSEQTSYKSQQPMPPKRRSSVSRKRTIEVDDVSDDDDNGDADGTSRRSKKRSRSSSSASDENCLPQRQRLSSTQPISSLTKSLMSTEPEVSITTTAVVQPTLKGPSRVSSAKNANNTSESNKKQPSRSRRFREDELSFLDAVYKTEPYPDPMITERLSIQLDVPEHRIKVWFANRRHRQSKDRDNNKSVSVTKPVTTVTPPITITTVTPPPPITMEKPITIEKPVVTERPVSIEKHHQLVTETAALPAESSHASSAFPSSPSFTPQYGMVPSGYEYIHQPLTPSPLPTPPPPPVHRTSADLAAAESHLRAQIASRIHQTPTDLATGESHLRAQIASTIHRTPTDLVATESHLRAQIASTLHRTPADLAAAESHLRAQIASTIQSRFPFSSPALIQLANQTMLSRSGLNPYHHPPLHYPVGPSMPSGGLTLPPGAGVADYCDWPKRRPSYSYYVEPPILPPLPAESTSYTDGISLSPAIDDGPSPWHWMP